MAEIRTLKTEYEFDIESWKSHSVAIELSATVKDANEAHKLATAIRTLVKEWGGK